MSVINCILLVVLIGLVVYILANRNELDLGTETVAIHGKAGPGEWSEWSQLVPCSGGCNGTRLYARTCTDETPCAGERVKTELCNECYKIQQNRLLRILPAIGRQYEVKLDVMANKFTNSWQNILHLTTGENVGGEGDRIPAIFFHRDLGNKTHRAMMISSAVSENHNHYFVTTPLRVKRWHSVRISQSRSLHGRYIYEIHLNNALAHSVENSNAKVFQQVRVYQSDGWGEALDGRVRNLQIRTTDTKS